MILHLRPHAGLREADRVTGSVQAGASAHTHACPPLPSDGATAKQSASEGGPVSPPTAEHAVASASEAIGLAGKHCVCVWAGRGG